ncbi:hypothetical protein COW96_00715, partial [Candidatus Roizmanbacteria bacterium CG22_combo_CG10-13_8_21_14_all_33_16]
VYNYLIYNVYCVWIPSYEGMTKTDISFCVNYTKVVLKDIRNYDEFAKKVVKLVEEMIKN